MSGAERRTVELYLLRHAHAGDPAAWTGPDELRPLSAKGERQAERLGVLLASVRFRPDAILTSPKLRASQTAEIVAGHLSVPVTAEERLAGALDAATVEAIVRDAGDPARVVLVGHDPDFSELVEALAGTSGVSMRKGALVRLDTSRPVSDGGAELRWLVPPDLLEARR
ncbi:MAG: histidine phosphatase family protein [Chloroflexi bacterium]|nr:histidine phosphatase family protein [Chloroflexota bacterium]